MVMGTASAIITSQRWVGRSGQIGLQWAGVLHETVRAAFAKQSMSGPILSRPAGPAAESCFGTRV